MACSVSALVCVFHDAGGRLFFLGAQLRVRNGGSENLLETECQWGWSVLGFSAGLSG